jgi:hypothetical protein
MSETKIYNIPRDLSDKIREFLENPFEGIGEAKSLLKEKEQFTEDEINKIVALIGKFPAYSVYQILGQISEKVIEVDGQ